MSDPLQAFFIYLFFTVRFRFEIIHSVFIHLSPTWLKIDRKMYVLVSTVCNLSIDTWVLGITVLLQGFIWWCWKKTRKKIHRLIRLKMHKKENYGIEGEANILGSRDADTPSWNVLVTVHHSTAVHSTKQSSGFLFWKSARCSWYLRFYYKDIPWQYIFGVPE